MNRRFKRVRVCVWMVRLVRGSAAAGWSKRTEEQMSEFCGCESHASHCGQRAGIGERQVWLVPQWQEECCLLIAWHSGLGDVVADTSPTRDARSRDE